jgi:hypothetical protein
VRRLSLAAPALLLSACGYIGEPMYPLLNIPMQVTNLAVVERGAVLVYQFDLPALTTEGKIARIGEVELRAGEPGPPPFNLGEWEKQSERFDVDAAGAKHVQGQIAAARWAGRDVAIAVKVYGVNRRSAGWSSPMLVTVVPPLPVPAGIDAAAVAEGVRVTWTGPTGRYNVFRRGEQDKEFALMATVEANQWVDTGTEYNKKYDYIVQMTQKTGTVDVQSDLSPAKSVTPEDKFPPAVPSGLNAILATVGVELVWDRNTESDLAGYRLYRALGDGKLEKIAEIADAPSYSDRKLESGKQYRYVVSAVDRLGNESALSAPVEITAP